MDPTPFSPTPPPDESGPSFGWGLAKGLLIGLGLLIAAVIVFVSSASSLSNGDAARVALALGVTMIVVHLGLMVRFGGEEGVPARHRKGLWIGASIWWAVLLLNPLSLCAMVLCASGLH